MSQIMSRTKIRTCMAVTADRCCSLQIYRRSPLLLHDNNMVLWKNQDCVRCFCNRIRTVSDTSHHRAAYEIYRIFHSCSACLGNNLFQCASQWNFHCNRILNFCNNGNIFACNRFVFFYRAVYIVECLYIEYGYSLLDWQSSWPYHTSGCLINKNNLITHRINLIQKMDLNPREFFNMLI